MTTIAWKDGVLAADRRTGRGGWRAAPIGKIWVIEGWAVSACGVAVTAQRLRGLFAAAARKGDPTRAPLTEAAGFEEATLIAARRSARLGVDWDLAVCEGGAWLTLDPDQPQAWGSGMPPALGAMLAGAEAPKAVEIAAEIEPEGTGDGVDFIDLALGLSVTQRGEHRRGARRRVERIGPGLGLIGPQRRGRSAA